ncbi:MAG: DUF4349 domain-containing protein [Cyanobacteria bacterium J06634_6]
MKRLWFALLTGSVVAMSGLTSCGAAYDGAAPETAAADVQESGAVAQNVSADAESAPAETSATQRPQLIKKAHISLSVDSVEDSFEQVRGVIAQQQGDVLSMQDTGDRNRSVRFTLRVPQERLDATLDALTELGKVESRSITTDDVSGQLVDLQARLANARKSEEALQEIMSRSGDISDVLDVSRELSNVRQSIEQMAAQQKSLQTQVRYSTVTVNLESAIALSPSKPAFSRQLSNSWGAATSSVGDFTTDLLQLGLWLLAYSPYLAVLACGGVLLNRMRRANRNSPRDSQS